MTSLDTLSAHLRAKAEAAGRDNMGVPDGALLEAADHIDRLRKIVEEDDDTLIAIARQLCGLRGYDPDKLEPGNVILHPSDDFDEWESEDGVFLDELADNGTRPPDGYNRNGEKCHFFWRNFLDDAQQVARMVRDLP